MPDERQQIVTAARAQIDGQLAGRGAVRQDVVVRAPSGRSGRAAELAVVAPGAEHTAGGGYRAADLEAVLEVTDRSRRAGDPAGRHRFLAECGIPLYVVVDPVAAVCTVHSAPQPGGTYREAERVPFGNDLFLPLAERTLVLRTDDFPVGPATPDAEPGGGRGIVDG
ncbi:Uma2 family endonuclease [Kitasatospora sp. NPDC087315]|uniref:Uma2 family endonuclease n=1 Tax=Kitasatospora sp. NPDC087315 TaxID=3364069 RepID=UPI0038238318